MFVDVGEGSELKQCQDVVQYIGLTVEVVWSVVLSGGKDLGPDIQGPAEVTPFFS
jgi:hypothetical protein